MDNYAIDNTKIGMEIFYEKSGQKIGPIEVSRLELNVIDRDTLVWHKGMDDWIPAENIPELNEYFKNFPPPLPSKKKSAVGEIYDRNYEKESEATLLGVLLIVFSIAIYFVRIILLPDVEQGYFLVFGGLVKIACAFYAGRIAKELNRSPGGWFTLTLFPTAISLIILGQLPKLKERRVSDFERALNEVNKEESI